ncbi:hypothetical protein [Allomesorhizobium camelthorni]|uniref:hypothetical protein n=1 Tax=Allomesorhizobium camelthorni TaxID=475069 RepID=UPI00197F05DF|nr:hypothetical protein [Mesorhizobium camelthorni]
MVRTTRPNDMTAKRRAAEAGKPAVGQPASDENAPKKRVGRLEESVRGNDGLGISRADRGGLDGSETEDALKRAVVRSNIKRGSRKA